MSNFETNVLTTDQIIAPVWNELIRTLDLNAENDWESIATCFGDLFEIHQIIQMKRDLKRTSPSTVIVSIMNRLRDNLVPINRLYECFVKHQIKEACNILEKEYPNETIKKSKANENQPLNMKNSYSFSNSEQNQNTTNARKTPENKENLIPMKTNTFLTDINGSQGQMPILSLLAPETAFFLSSTMANNTGVIGTSHNNYINKIQKQILDEKASDLQRISAFIPQKSLKQQMIQKIDNSFQQLQPHQQSQLYQQNQDFLSQDTKQEEQKELYLNLVGIYEGILPVVEEKNINPIDEGLNAEFKLLGHFELKYIEERNLKFRIRKFYNLLEYVKELSMVKHRHANLYTAEGILKKGIDDTYFLFYPHDIKQTELLSDYAKKFHMTSPKPQLHILNPFFILRDIAAGLSYLHTKNKKKLSFILHGNLLPRSIMIQFDDKKQVSAKIFDFTDAIEIYENTKNIEAKVRDEIFKFGLIFFMVLTWRYMFKDECDRVHEEVKTEKKESNKDISYFLFKKYQHEIPFTKLEDKYGICHILLLFYNLTSADYDITKGIDRILEFLNKTIEHIKGSYPN